MGVKQHRRSAREKAREKGSGERGSFGLLWGSTERPRRGPKPGLSLEAIVEAATQIADTEGLAALTMSRVATQLGVTTMALYRYVPGKGELLDLMIDAACGPPPAPTGRGWRPDFAEWARASLALFLRHPWFLETMLGRVAIGPNWLAWLESALRAVSGIGLTPPEMMAVVLLVDGHVRGAAQISLGATGTAEWATNFGRVIETVSNDPRYPVITAVMTGGGFENSASDSDFDFGLERLMDGIEGYIKTRAVRRRQRTVASRRPSRPAKVRS
jgi:AcrR family transcriptional regulator